MTLALIKRATLTIIGLYEPGQSVSVKGRELIASAEAGWRDSDYALVDCTVTDPPFDPATQVRSGPVDVVTPRTLTPCSRTYAVRAMTQQELDDYAAIAELDAIARVQFKIALLQENRIRALEGKQPITKRQFLDWVKQQTA